MIQVYGISQCSSVKKARQWLAEKQVDYEFIDFKKNPPSVANIEYWLRCVGAEYLINRRGTTWRKLSAEEQELSSNHDDLIQLILHNPSLIKRPLIVWETGQMTVGFDETLFIQHALTQK